ncbi:MAG TPA: hypothetical protein VKB27_15345, partial [Gammaproteobacteria bacterium]|nr:hypothetical protein [Gammaproteobacteria bacterium]
MQSLVVALVFVVVTLVGIQFFSSFIVILITASLGAVALSWRLFRALYKQIELQQFKVFRQSESLAGLYATLDIQRPLPRTRHWAASPDFLHLMAGEIFRLQPELIVEAGSGTSTLMPPIAFGNWVAARSFRSTIRTAMRTSAGKRPMPTVSPISRKSSMHLSRNMKSKAKPGSGMTTPGW